MLSLGAVIAGSRQATGDVLHGRTVEDPYRWLEDADAPEVGQWLAVQHRVFIEHRVGWPLLPELRNRITQALDGEQWSPPKLRGTRLFVTRRVGHADHPCLLVLDAGQARMLVDVLALDVGGTDRLDGTTPHMTENRPNGLLFTYGYLLP